ITLDDNAKGTLSTTTISSTSVAAAQTALRAITFNPTDNRVAPGSTETTTFTITVNDGTTNSTPNNTTTVISTSVNDAPTDIALSSASVNQSGGANATVGTISSTDADTGDTATYTLVAGSGDTHNGIFTIATSCALGGSCTSTLRANDPSVLNAGTYSIRLNVNDGDEDFAKAFTITLIDDVSPTLSSISTSNITVNTIDLKATSNETGVMYFSISTTSSIPTANDMLTNKVSNSIDWNYRDVSANVEKIYSVSGLSANTKYYYYIMSKDTTGSSVINTSIISNGSFTTKALDTDSTLTGGTSIDESSMISIPTTVKTLASKVNVFDFKITDLGTGDALSTDIEQIDIAVSGTAVSNASKITWVLNGPNITNKTGAVSNNTITFSSLSSSISDGGNGTYTLSAYWNNPTGLTDNQTFGLTLTNLNIGVNTDKSTLASNQSVTNNTNAKVDVTATKLIFNIQPSNIGND
ncbi:hypothetical protein, partial [Poseidonibacter sp.]|uniref:hypothetical protein n=1 Tax=Poseidonibacter sp. TaxID=2321188 RepID=UPI003C71C119